MDDFHAESSSFLTWLAHRGASISSNIQLADLRHRDAGRGVVATSPLPVNTELFRIPRSAILTPSTSSIPANVLNELSDPWLTLILALVYEYQLDSASAWKSYVDLLPFHFDTIMFWTDAELKLLVGSAVVDKIGKPTADETFKRELLPRIRTHAAEFRAESRTDEQLLDLCHRMGSVIMAYAFDLEDPEAKTKREEESGDGWEEDSDEGAGQSALPKGMVPLADMLNADADRNNAKLFYEDDFVVMKTIKDVGQDEELYNDYGPLPRADVLRRYGYVTDNYSKYDVVEISLNSIKDQATELTKLTDKDVEERTEYLSEQGVLDDAYDIARPENEDGQFSDEMCALLNTLTMPKDEFDRLRGKEKLPKPELSDAACELLRAVALKRYSMYPERVQTANGDDDGLRFRMAAAVIEGEKAVLQDAVRTATQVVSNKKRSADTSDDKTQQTRSKKR